MVSAWNVCPVQLPGRDARMMEPAITDATALVDAMHAALKPHLTQPYALFGHSMGALLAALWAQRIEREGLLQPMALVLSGRGAPSERPVFPLLETMSDEELLHALDARFGGDSATTLMADPELRAHYLPLLRADLAVVDSADVTRFVEPLRVSTYVLRGADDPAVPLASAERWRRHGAGAFRLQSFPGNHFFHFNDSEAAVLKLLEEIATAPSR